MKKKELEQNLGRLIILLAVLAVSDFLLLVAATYSPVVTVEYKNQSCNYNNYKPIDTSYNLSINENVPSVSEIWQGMNQNKTCFRIPSPMSPMKCEYVKLKNGTLISTGLCSVTFNYILKCVDNSEIEGKVTQ